MSAAQGMPPSARPSEIRAALTDLEQAIRAAGHVAGLTDMEVLAARATGEARRLAGVDLVSIALVDTPGSVAMIGAAGALTQEFPHLRWRVAPGAGIAGTVLERREALSVDDYPNLVPTTFAPLPPELRAAPEALLLRDTLIREGVRGLLSVPIEHEGEVLGVLYAGARTPGHLETRIGQQLERFADLIAPAIVAARRAQETARSSVEAERSRIAFDLHDTIGQILFGIGARAQSARLALGEAGGAVAAELERIAADASAASAHLRETLRSLDAVTGSDLASGLRLISARFRLRTGTPVETVVLGEAPGLHPEAEALLLAAAREALHNVHKHAAAHSVVVTLAHEGGAVELVVQDDGRGPPDDLSPPGDGGRFGLAALARRLAAFGGALDLSRNDDGGATLRVTLSAAGF